MKSKIYVFALALGLASAFSTSSFGQGTEKGTVIIDPYFGFPNFGKALLQASVTEGATDVKVGGVGPLGLRVEYLVGDRFGLTLDGIYNTSSLTFSDLGSVYNSTTGMYEYVNYDYKLKMSRLRVQVGMNYHLGFGNENLDPYIGIAAGSNNRTFSTTSNDPNYVNESLSGTLLPVSMRLRAGMRFYFTENIGINFEIGLGGPVLSGGLSVRL
jgi:outer membrane protein W